MIKFLEGDMLLIILLVQYILIGIVYGLNDNWGKCLYFVGASILSIGVLIMK